MTKNFRLLPSQVVISSRLAVIAGTILTFGCEGHSQRATVRQERVSSAPSAAGKQRLIPEYEPRIGSLVSHDINVVDSDLNITSALAGAGTVWSIGSKKSYKFSDPGFATIGNLLAHMKSKLSPNSFPQVRTVSSSTSTNDFAGLWMRDYGPGFARSTDGSNVVKVLRYQAFSQQGSTEVPELFAKAAGLALIDVPVRMDGGNILINSDGVCLRTEGGTPGRNPTEKDQSEAEVHLALRDFAGCTDIIALPPIPGEGTGHVDMFFKFLANKFVAVGQMDDTAVADSGEPDVALEQQKSLRNAKRILIARGFRVVDIPVPAIVFGGQDAMNRSYVNGIILNGTIYVPKFENFYAIQHFEADLPEDDDNKLWQQYPDQNRTQEYEKAVKEAYEGSGLKVAFVKADKVAAYYGALHCAVIGVPKF